MLHEIMDALELSFDFFNERLFNDKLPIPIISIQNRGKENAYGWCSTQPSWYDKTNDKQYYEINFCAEYINRPFEDTMSTLIHEMVHLSNISKGIEDCSKKQYHNEKFKIEAERIGLIVKKIKQHGWAETTLSDELIELCNELNVAKDIFTIARYEKPVKVVTKRNSKVKLVCPNCGRKISADDEDISVICGECNCEFIKK